MGLRSSTRVGGFQGFHPLGESDHEERESDVWERESGGEGKVSGVWARANGGCHVHGEKASGDAKNGSESGNGIEGILSGIGCTSDDVWGCDCHDGDHGDLWREIVSAYNGGNLVDNGGQLIWSGDDLLLLLLLLLRLLVHRGLSSG